MATGEFEELLEAEVEAEVKYGVEGVASELFARA
jgi:hypothetical protein